MLSLSTVTRRASALALATSLLASTLGPAPTPSHAADLQPAARLNVRMNSVKILNAKEGYFDDDGEFTLDFRLVRCNEGVPAPCLGPDGNHVGASEEIAGMQKKFDLSLSTTFELQSRQRDLANAKTRELQAIIAYSRALIIFEAIQKAPVR